MARVVQRKNNNPPYLLMVFVFLTLIFGTLMSITFFKSEEKDVMIKKQEERIVKLANQQQLSSPNVVSVLNNLSTDSTVVGELNKQIDELTKVITGNYCSTESALKQHDALATKVLGGNSLRGLIAEVADMKMQREKVQAEADRLRAEIAQAQQDLKSAIEAQKAQKEAFDKASGELTAQNTTLSEENQKYQTDQKTKFDEIKVDQQRVVDGLNKNINQLTQKVQSLELKNQQLEIRNGQMVAEFRKSTMPQIEIDKLAKTPKGKIAEVVDQIAYINKGSKDRIVPGLTFAVYPSTGIPEDGVYKATIHVLSVSENTSECRIKGMKITNPVLSGDLIGNVAFDPLRTYTFVIKGRFDLHGTGVADARQGYKEVEDMIVRSGGKVVNELTIKTDFLVLGDEPTPPPKLNEDSTDPAAAEKKKIYDDFDLSKRQAADLFIPVLNSNRFLSLMGYAPDKSR